MDLAKKIEKSITIIRKQAVLTRIIVGLSGGKDSLVLCQLFKLARIRPIYFHMYFMPNLRIEHDLIAYPSARFDICQDDIYQYPSEHFLKCFKYGFYTWSASELKRGVIDIRRKQLFAMISKQHRSCICTGVKKADGIQMQRLLERNNGIGIYPLEDWTTADVFAFLQAHKIELPPLTLKGCRGVGITDEGILFMSKHYPDDLERIESIFPFVKAIAYKYKYYDLKAKIRIV